MSVTTWHRLEPVPRSSNLRPALRAELADPLWALGRQWQFGEFAGEDAGSPIESVTTVEVAPVTRYHAGASGTRPASRARDLDEITAPIEAVVERRRVTGTVAGVRRRVDGGQHFLRLLALHRAAANQSARWTSAFPLDPTDDLLAAAVADDRDGAAWFRTVAGRVPDGEALAEELRALRDPTDGQLTGLPDPVDVPATQQARVTAAATAWLDWWDRSVDEPEPDAAGDAWNPRRLEYAFATQATFADGDVVLHADDYGGGRLDWYEYEADHRGRLGERDGAGASRASRRLVRRAVPTAAYYSGMPADRFWEFEPTTVRFGSTSVGRTDLAHLLLDEFALGYGVDWFVIPLTLPTGSVCAVRELRVRDTFGVETVVEATNARDGWQMFQLSCRPGAAARTRGLLHLPATVPVSQEGDPIEEIGWFRDELANVVWAVERRTAALDGGSIDRYEHAQRGLAPGTSQRVPTDVGDAQLVYRLQSHVPENWHPLVPVRPPDAPAGATELELRPIDRVAADGTVERTPPRGRLLNSADPLVVAEEEVDRGGRRTQLHWQLTRGVDGTYHAWLSHRVGAGRGEGSSGLLFDISRPVQRRTR